MLYAIPDAVIAYWVATRGSKHNTWLWLAVGAVTGSLIEVIATSFFLRLPIALLAKSPSSLLISVIFHAAMIGLFIFLIRRATKLLVAEQLSSGQT